MQQQRQFVEPRTISTTVPYMIELRGVNLSYGTVQILKNINLRVKPGSATIIMGTSGAGKSTILKLILGLIKPDSGTIYVDGEEISTYTEEDLMPVRQKLGMVFQENALFDSLTVRENVGYVLYERALLPEDEIERRIFEMLELVELEEMIDKMPAELSGGQKRRVAIARAMAALPQIILYDEPTAGLDPVTANTIIKQAMKLRDFMHITTIVVTHKVEDAFKLAYNKVVKEDDTIRVVKDISGERLRDTRLIMIREGELEFDGSAEEFRNSPDPFIQEFLS